MFRFFGRKNRDSGKEEKKPVREEKQPVREENQPVREDRGASGPAGAPAGAAGGAMGFSIDTDAMFDMLRKLHDNADKNYNLGEIGLTEDEKTETLRAVENFKKSPLVGTLVSPSDVSKAGLVVQYEMTCDATIFGILDTCITASLGEAKNETLEKALKKLRDYQP